MSRLQCHRHQDGDGERRVVYHHERSPLSFRRWWNYFQQRRIEPPTFFRDMGIAFWHSGAAHHTMIAANVLQLPCPVRKTPGILRQGRRRKHEQRAGDCYPSHRYFSGRVCASLRRLNLQLVELLPGGQMSAGYLPPLARHLPQTVAADHLGPGERTVR
jgi:hypothetical protein